jgi:hypothetical protein
LPEGQRVIVNHANWWQRAKIHINEPADAALRTARLAEEDSARGQARRELLELGELLAQSQETPGGAEILSRALDAYAAAEKVLDAAADMADVAGVLVLVREGRDLAAMASGRASRTRATVPLCFFNPLHGVSARRVSWRPLGERQALVVRGCADCAERIRRRREPDALTGRAHGGDVPYYELDPSLSVWAATGYGQFCDDLIERVLSRDFPPRPHSR